MCITNTLQCVPNKANLQIKFQATRTFLTDMAEFTIGLVGLSPKAWDQGASQAHSQGCSAMHPLNFPKAHLSLKKLAKNGAF